MSLRITAIHHLRADRFRVDVFDDEGGGKLRPLFIQLGQVLNFGELLQAIALARFESLDWKSASRQQDHTVLEQSWKEWQPTIAEYTKKASQGMNRTLLRTPQPPQSAPRSVDGQGATGGLSTSARTRVGEPPVPRSIPE